MEELTNERKYITLSDIHMSVLGDLYNIFIESFWDKRIFLKENREKTLQYIKPLLERGELVMKIPFYRFDGKVKGVDHYTHRGEVYSDEKSANEMISILRKEWNSKENGNFFETSVGFALPENRKVLEDL